jgi:hypothetical protein
MKMLAATVALATLISAPALAQTGRRALDYGYYGYGQGYYAYGYAPGPSAYYAYGYAPGQAYGAYNQFFPRSANPAFDVYDTRDHYRGSDPDPRIRSQLRRDLGPANDE